MGNLVRWDRPRGVVHNVTTALEYGEGGCNILCVSDAALYVIQNLISLDAAFVARWADEVSDKGYIPISARSHRFQAWHDMVLRIQSEVLDMNCDLEAGLLAIAEALRSAPRGGSGSNCYPGNLADCLVNVPNEDWTPPEESTEANPETDPPPEGFDTWEEFFLYKCQAAHYIWQWLVNLALALGGVSGLQLTSAIVVPIIAGFAGLLPAAFTPVGFVAFVSAIVAIAAISILGISAAIGMGNYLHDHKSEIVCALYTSGSSADALSALALFIEDAIEAGILASGLGAVTGPLVATLLGEAFSLVQNTGLVEPLFKLVADVAYPDADCDCAAAGECFLVTTDDPDLLNVDIGLVEQSGATSPSGGWRTNTAGVGGGHVTFGFITGASAVSALQIKCYMADNAPSHTVKLQVLDHPAHTIIDEITGIPVTQPNNGTWAYYSFNLPITLSANTRYDLRLPEDPTGLEVWINRVSVCQYG